MSESCVDTERMMTGEDDMTTKEPPRSNYSGVRDTDWNENAPSLTVKNMTTEKLHPMTEQVHQILIPGLPEGWEPVAYRKAKKGEWNFMEYGDPFKASEDHMTSSIIVQKTKPRRIVLEETEEDAECNEQHFLYAGVSVRIDGKKIWREIVDVSSTDKEEE